MEWQKYHEGLFTQWLIMFLIGQGFVFTLLFQQSKEFCGAPNDDWVKQIKYHRKTLSTEQYDIRDANLADTMNQVFAASDDNSDVITIIGKAEAADKNVQPSVGEVKLVVKKQLGAITVQISKRQNPFPLHLVEWSNINNEESCVSIRIEDPLKREWKLSFTTRCKFLQLAIVRHLHSYRMVWKGIDKFWKNQDLKLARASVMEIRFNPNPPTHFSLIFFEGEEKDARNAIASFAIQDFQAERVDGILFVGGKVLINHSLKRFEFPFPTHRSSSAVIKSIYEANAYDHVIPLKKVIMIEGFPIDFDNLNTKMSMPGYELIAWKNKETHQVEQLGILDKHGRVVWDVWPDNSDYFFTPDHPKTCFQLHMLFEDKLDEVFFAQEFCDLLVMDLFQAFGNEITMHEE